MRHLHPMFQQPWTEGEFRFFQVGFIVDDLAEHAMRWARTYGVGPFFVRQRNVATCTYRGVQSTMDIQTAIAQSGPVQIELVAQYDDNASVIRDFIPKGSSGFHQLCTVTPDYDGKRSHYEALGYELACEIVAGPQRVGYFDTWADFGFITEVVEGGDLYMDRWSRVAKACASWDGNDPVRYADPD